MPHSHVHIGAGLFGLGMVFDLCEKAGFKSVVLNRDSNDPQHKALRRTNKCRIIYDGNSSNSRTLDVSHYYYKDATDTRAIQLIAEPSVALLTTAVTPEGLPAVAPLIASAVEMRRTNGAPPLWVMACENLQLNSQRLSELVAPHLSKTTRDSFFRTGVFFSNTVVDRVCANMAEASDCVDVSVESFCEWIIEPPASELEAAGSLSRVPEVKFVGSRPELEAYEMRKYWCLNGFHLAAAAYAYNYDNEMVFLSEALLNRDILAKVQALQEDLGFAFRCYAERTGVTSIFAEEAVKQYNDNLVVRFIRNRKERIARLLKHEEGIEETIRDFIDSIVEPEIQEIVDLVDEATLKRGTSQQLHQDLQRVLKDKLKGVLDKKLEKSLRLLDIHQFLRRVTDRIVGPQDEILSYHMRRREVCQRLDLDDALQTIVIAMSKRTKRAYDTTVASLREVISD